MYLVPFTLISLYLSNVFLSLFDGILLLYHDNNIYLDDEPFYYI